MCTGEITLFAPPNVINDQIPADKAVRVILADYAAHKHPKVRAWLDLGRETTSHTGQGLR